MAGLGLAALVPLTGLAQDNEDGDVFELSPFTVETGEDIGYMATSTLAGTRLNTRLSDVGASISVATAEFMKDIGSNDLESLLTYTGGTESVGMYGNSQGANLTENQGQVREERTNARQQKNTRIRGLARADLTKDLFLTDAPFDSYNIERVTISRGANSALFGLGSPGGVLDATLKKANFNNRGEFEVKIDNWGTERFTLDLNRVIVDDVLAIRIAGLKEDTEWEQKTAYESDERLYANVLVKPTRNTTIRGTYSTGEIRAARPVTSPPRDYISSWVEIGQPLYNPADDRFYASMADYAGNNPIPREQSNDLWVGTAVDPDILGRGGEITSNGGRRLSIIFPDPNSPLPGGFNGSPQGMQTGITNPSGNSDGWPGGAQTQWYVPTEMINIWRQPVGSFPSARGLSADEAPYYQSPVVTDTGMFNYRKIQQSTPSKLESGDIEHFNVSLEQTFLNNNLGFLLAYDQQTYEDNLIKYNRLNSLDVDINLTLADGTPNPNVGRAYLGGSGFAEPERTEREAWRFQGYYQLDFADKSEGWLKNLGRHVLTASISGQEIQIEQQTHMPVTSGNDWQTYTEGRDNQAIGGLNRTVFISYVSPSLIGNLDTSTYGIGGVNVVQRAPDVITDVIAWDAARANAYNWSSDQTLGNIAEKQANMIRGGQSFTMREYLDDPAKTWTWGGRGSLSKIESKAAVLQSFFLGGHVVTTVSWRSDDVDIYSYGTIRDSDGERLHTGFAPVPDEPSLSVSGKETVSYSIVLHSPDWINKHLPAGTTFSVHYNDSSNFDAASYRTDIFNNEIPQQEGSTKDYGFTINTFDNKLVFKANWYESEQVGASVNPIGRPNNIWRDILSWNTPEEIAASGITPPPAGFLEAYEFEKDGTQNEVVLSEIARDGSGNIILDTNGNPVINETSIFIDNWNSRNPQQNQIETAVGKTESKGMELELIWNPTKNWRLAFNVTRAEAIRSDIAAAEQQHLADMLPQWLDPNKGGVLWRSGGRQTIIRDNNNVITDIQPNNSNLILNPGTGELHNSVTGFMGDLAKLVVFDGLPVPELREYRANLIANYTFDERAGEFLSRFGIGGALRWEEGAFLGTGLTRNEGGGLVQDLSNIYYGPSNTRLDLWITYRQKFKNFTWRSRLGISDITSDAGLIATKANPDGTYGSFRIEPDTTISWTNTISF